MAAYAYLKGISEKDVASVLSTILGPEVKNLGRDVISRLKSSWIKDFDTWGKRDLSNYDFAYVYADGIYQEIRGDNQKLCVLVIIGIDQSGDKHLIALEDGSRESTQSWREVLLNLKQRELKSPKLAVGDGAMGFWAAIREIYPDTKEQRCWMHKTGNILNHVPKSIHGKVKSDIHNIWMAESKSDAKQAIKDFSDKYGAKYSKAVNCLIKDESSLLAFYDFPAEHWAHIRTTNAIESTFATLRHRTIKVKGAFSKDSALSMMFQLTLEAKKTWKKISAVEKLAELIESNIFEDGIKQEEAKAS